MDPEAPRRLTEEQWEEYGLRLTRFAQRRLSRYVFRGFAGGATPSGRTAEDFAYDAIVAWITGERKWDPAKKDLLTFLRDTVGSMISHETRSAANLHETHVDWVPEGAFECDMRETIVEIDAKLAHDAELRSVLRCVAEGYVKPADCAQCMEVDVSTSVNARRRLGRWMEANGYGPHEL